MIKGLDWSFANLDVEDMPRWGYTVAFRYLSWQHPDSMAKILTPAKRDRILRVMDLIPNWEWYGTRAKEGGRAGEQDGAEAHRQLVNLAYPVGRQVVFSDDDYTDASNIRSVLEYRRGFAAACPSYEVTVYGNRYCVDAVFDAFGTRGWQNNWNHRANVPVSPHAFAWQNGNQAYNGGADENILYPPFTSWKRGNPAPPPKHVPAPTQIPKGVDMQGYIHRQREGTREKPKDVYYLISMDLTSRVLIADPNTLSALLATGQYIGPTKQGFNHISQVQAARIPVVTR